MSLVLIMDSNLDKGLLSPTGNHSLVAQIKAQGVAVDPEIQEIMVTRYKINPSKVILLKNKNFILLQEPGRVRVFIVE
jgi:hypothetical protein